MNLHDKPKKDKEQQQQPVAVVETKKPARKLTQNKNIAGSGKKLGAYRMPQKIENIRKSTESSKIIRAPGQKKEQWKSPIYVPILELYY